MSTDALTISEAELLAAALEYGRRQCRRGNPFPLMAAQWPQLLVTDPAEAEWFEGEIGSADDPCLRLDFWQRDIIKAFFAKERPTDSIGPDAGWFYRQMAVKGCTKAGKGAAVAMAINLWWYLFTPCKILLTSATVKHVEEGLFSEVAAWRRRMQDPGEGQIMSGSLKHSDEQKYLTIGNTGTGEGFSGHHGPHTLFCFDEASGSTEEVFGLALTQARFIASLSNPRTLSGWFRRLFPRVNPDETQTVGDATGRRRLITVSGWDCLNVRSERSLIPDQVTPMILAGVMANEIPWWGRVFGEGKFPLEDAESQLFLPSWFERHEKAWPELKAKILVRAFGLDVGASEAGDRTVLTAGGLEGIAGVHVRKGGSGGDTMETVGWLFSVARVVYGIDLVAERVPVVVDVVGVGKGVYDRLRELGVNVFPNTGKRTMLNKAVYRNRRAENYGEFALRLDPNGPYGETPFALPADSELRDELCAPEKIYDSDGMAFKLTPKERKPGSKFKGQVVREKLGRSPDKADSVVYFYSAICDMVRKQTPKVHRPLTATAYGAGQGFKELKRKAGDEHPEPRPVQPPRDHRYERVTSIEGPKEIVDLVADIVREMDEYDD